MVWNARGVWYHSTLQCVHVWNVSCWGVCGNLKFPQFTVLISSCLEQQRWPMETPENAGATSSIHDVGGIALSATFSRGSHPFFSDTWCLSHPCSLPLTPTPPSHYTLIFLPPTPLSLSGSQVLHWPSRSVLPANVPDPVMFISLWQGATADKDHFSSVDLKGHGYREGGIWKDMEEKHCCLVKLSQRGEREWIEEQWMEEGRFMFCKSKRKEGRRDERK